MKLVIVESPAKCVTIKKYLGEGYNVMASYGHVRDLAISGKGGLGVDIDNEFTPTYIINKDKYKTVHDLQNAARECDEVLLATDPDREGEAIAWHLATVLNLDVDNTRRLEFHEITRDSITAAINNTRTIDKNLVASQETRRIIDRVIGFKLSTLLNKKIGSRSAGRVQSATLDMIYNHDLEIENFIPEEYWNILVKAVIAGKEMDINFVGKNNKKFEINNEQLAYETLKSIPEKLTIVSVNKDFRTKESKEPFTTSTMQQEAFARLKFKTSKTQMIAQQLYEGINVGDEHVGLITYMRTDSTRLSPVYIASATNYINEVFGKEYLGRVKSHKADAMVQDAHEAIRPTSNHRTPESIRKYLTNDQYNLYKLIYTRALASLMKPKKEEVLSIGLEGNGNDFKIEFAHTVFKGYEIISADPNEPKDYSGKFPELNIGDEVVVSSKNTEQKFTQAPAHYSEAKVVKLMEEAGIGRPSTYAFTIENIIKSGYVKSDKGVLTITEQGKLTARKLEKHFPGVVDAKYTASIEEQLDHIEGGNKSRLDILNRVYIPFNKNFEKAQAEMTPEKIHEFVGRDCPICGAPLVVRDGKNGKFVGCSKYPDCEYVEKEEKKTVEYTGELCPKCGKQLVYRAGKKGNRFIACIGYPTCDYKVYPEEQKKAPTAVETDKICPDCGSPLVKRKGKFGYFLGCSNFPKCKYMEIKKKSYSKKKAE